MGTGRLSRADQALTLPVGRLRAAAAAMKASDCRQRGGRGIERGDESLNKALISSLISIEFIASTDQTRAGLILEVGSIPSQRAAT